MLLSYLKIFTLKNFLGWLRYCNEAHFCDCCRNMGQFLRGAELWCSQEFCSGGANHLTFVGLFLPFIFEQLKWI